VKNSATKGIQGMKAVSNLPISTWLTAAARRGFPAVKIRQRKPNEERKPSAANLEKCALLGNVQLT